VAPTTLARLGRPAEILAAALPHLPAGRRRTLKSLLLACGPLLEVEGADRLARVAEPAIFALNHANHAEALLAPAALLYLRRGCALHFLADWMFLELPLLGPLLRLGDPIPVYGKRARFGWREAMRRAGRRERTLDRCLARLAEGASLGLFPEGRRGGDPRRLLAPRPGVGELALRGGVPVVPVGIRYPAAKRLGRAPHLGRTVLAVGEPVDLAAERELFAAVAKLTAPAARAERRDLARRAAARVMAALAELAGEGCQGTPIDGRGSAWLRTS
jgi:1-acyl-sn-glycerol-3-phosphate acyltransferase